VSRRTHVERRATHSDGDAQVILHLWLSILILIAVLSLLVPRTHILLPRHVDLHSILELRDDRRRQLAGILALQVEVGDKGARKLQRRNVPLAQVPRHDVRDARARRLDLERDGHENLSP
jgi:hypothetical protein